MITESEYQKILNDHKRSDIHLTDYDEAYINIYTNRVGVRGKRLSLKTVQGVDMLIPDGKDWLVTFDGNGDVYIYNAEAILDYDSTYELWTGRKLSAVHSILTCDVTDVDFTKSTLIKWDSDE